MSQDAREDSAPHVVVVGASVAGARLAQELRQREFAGRVTVIDADRHHPYDKPPLSKGLLEGSTDMAGIDLLPEASVAGLALDLRLGTAAAGLDLRGREVILEDDERIAFDELVIATGVRARTAPWTQVPGVRTLRTLDDALAVRDDLDGAEHLIVCGAGFIGSEAASAACRHGVAVTIIDPLEVPMARVAGDAVGRLFVDLHERHGVATRFGVAIVDIMRSAHGFDVRLADGSVVSGDAVLAGIGAVPNTEWLEGSGLVLDNGVVCDGHLKAVGADRVFAIGDVARWDDGVRGLTRIEHWTNAGDQAAYVAEAIAGQAPQAPFTSDGYVWSDQYDWHIQLAGRSAASGTQTILVGDPAEHAAVLYADSAGGVTGVLAVNWPRALMGVRRALRGKASMPLDEALAIVEKARPKRA